MSAVWYARQSVHDARLEFSLVFGEEYDDGAVVDVDPGPDRALVVAQVESGTVVDVRVKQHGGMWLVAQPEPAAQPPAMTLVAFDSPDLPEGTVIPSEEFTSLPVRSAQQVGAVRWFTGTGQVHQVYVAPQRRRQGIGTALLLAAGTYAVASGWPRLWGNGERTDLGESLVTRGHEVVRRRATARTRVLPPMTPGDAV